MALRKQQFWEIEDAICNCFHVLKTERRSVFPLVSTISQHFLFLWKLSVLDTSNSIHSKHPLVISPAFSLTCWQKFASPACSIAISVSHNTGAPDGRLGKHLPPELSPIQFPSINQQLGVKNHSLFCLACSCQRLSTLELHFPSYPVLGEGKVWSISQISHMVIQPTTSKHQAILTVWRGFCLSTVTWHFLIWRVKPPGLSIQGCGLQVKSS